MEYIIPRKPRTTKLLIKELYAIEHGQTLLECELEIKVKLFFGILKSTSTKRKQLMLNKELRPTKRPD
ncbi:hypothetical protein Curi_c14750 [Gottschalkia acidurici 9a]|uniref:Uncharacterized protein n=1 Tax=Gottschalkia acidurici (strain ATCC 7906 / DSM 604 / BCRC 14475 / CIP 104303 / KCTC 5404 / NCIMB 10678 / 9a) TaxID=1128398 RepID=K0B0Q0_GOTA9|nr:RusA family crossover junction endodeoxyribonuclease [Gottschalkia acidurici]AFS78485.1 hypothetical protein Curi_c14750 [Gottschalkia acidurici 9a]